jgi:hypothetical protein
VRPLVQPVPAREDVHITKRDWIKVVIYLGGSVVLITGLLIWLVFTFVAQTCGCG